MCCVVSKNNVNSQQYHPRHSDSYLSHICYTVGSFDVRPNYVTNNNFSRISILRSTHCAKIKSTQNKHAIRYIHTHIHNFENVPTFDSHEPALVSHHLNMSGESRLIMSRWRPYLRFRLSPKRWLKNCWGVSTSTWQR